MRILLLADKPAYHENAYTIIEHIESFSKYSENTVHEFNPRNLRQKCPNLDSYDAVIVHYSLVICLNTFLSVAIRRKLHAYNGVKVLFIQDEYRFINATTNAMLAINFDIIFTNFLLKDVYKIYPKSYMPNTKFVTNLTGYASSNLNKIEFIPYEDREVDIFYRARKLSSWYGSLGYNKCNAAHKIMEYSEKHTELILDISLKEEDRLYGDEWLSHMSNAKCVLGSETGGSIMDFTGEIQRTIENYEKNNDEADFDFIKNKFFSGLDKIVEFKLGSPRLFEAASTKSMMVLLEGDYRGILKPWVHYIPIKEDYSNVAKICRIVQDKSVWSEITNNAYRDIIQSNKYNYKSFIHMVDKEINSCLEKKGYKNSQIISFEPDADYNNTEIFFAGAIICITEILFNTSLFLKNHIRIFSLSPLSKWLRSCSLACYFKCIKNILFNISLSLKNHIRIFILSPISKWLRSCSLARHFKCIKNILFNTKNHISMIYLRCDSNHLTLKERAVLLIRYFKKDNKDNSVKECYNISGRCILNGKNSFVEFYDTLIVNTNSDYNKYTKNIKIKDHCYVCKYLSTRY